MNTRQGYWAVVDPVWDSISIYDGAEPFLREFEKTSLVARSLFAAHWCQSEVCNGGLHQFFSNSTGVLAPEAIVAFRTIGMPGVAALVQRALQWFGDPYPREHDVRNERLDNYENEHPDGWNPFEELDNEFFRLIDFENGGFKKTADAYAASHAG